MRQKDRVRARKLLHSRLPAYVVGLGVVLAAASPVFLQATDDSFPLSTYPMFARPLGLGRAVFANGIDAYGKARRLDSRLIANDEVMQSFKTIRLAMKQGPEALAALCKSIATRVARNQTRPETERIELVVAYYDPIEYFVSEGEPESRESLASCRVRKPR